MALSIDGKFEGKLTCAFKNDMRNLANFHRLNFHQKTKSKKKKNSEQVDRPDAVRKLILSWK